MSNAVVIGLTAVIAAVTDEVPRLLVARRMTHGLATPAQAGTMSAPAADSPDSLPFGPFDPPRHRTLERGLRQWVSEQTGLGLRYVEQLYTFGNQYRDPRELLGGPRVVAIGYLALTHESPLAGTGEAQWRDWYSFLPWEDWRDGPPAVIDQVIRPALDRWIARADPETRDRRAERVALCFGFDAAAGQDSVRCLERYELLYEAGLVPEALRDRRALETAGLTPPVTPEPEQQAIAERLGPPMALDNRRILASALMRLRGKLAYRPVVFELMPPAFTLLQLQRVVEALAGMRLHKQNFRRMLTNGDLVEPTGRVDTTGRGRPAELFRFRREVLRERRAVGVTVSHTRTAS